MQINKLRRTVLLLICFLLTVSVLDNFATAYVGQNKSHNPKTTTTTKAKLTVIVVIDQFRADYLLRFKDLFGERGFKRLMKEGAYFTNANYAYSNTYTAVGHSTIATGSLPSIHGIIANKWFDPTVGKLVGASEDTKVTGVGTKQTSSPNRLLTTTIGDQLRLSNNYQSKNIGISIKDRAAIFISGRQASAAYWFDDKSGKMCSSSYFMKELPEWVSKFNEQHIPDQYFQKNWDRKLPIEAYQISDKDDADYEDTWEGNTNSFPHIINGNSKEITPAFYKQFSDSPFSSEMLLKFALTTIDNEKLGQGKYPDLLAVSFSAPDLAGHMFGPYSQEAQDMVVRIDEIIGKFLDELDRKVGLDNIVFTLTADHGVAPIPEYSETHSFSAGRINGFELKDKMEQALETHFGELEKDKYILSLVNHQFYLNETIIKKKQLKLAEVEEFLGKEALKTKGIANYFTRNQLMSGNIPNTDIGKRFMAGFNAERNGNVLLLVEPFVLIAEANDEFHGTAHGTPYHYDTHVPIIMMGKQVKAGIYREACSPSDIAPTLATLLEIEPPSGSVGRILTEALK